MTVENEVLGLGRTHGLPPVDELRESLMQTVDVLRAYLQSTERTIGGAH